MGIPDPSLTRPPMASSKQRNSYDRGDLMSVLVSCFEPFDGEFINASQEAVSVLSLRRKDLHYAVLPTIFSRAADELLYTIGSLGPELVIMLGEASGRCSISLERVALNFVNARIPDNEGSQPSHELIRPGGPLALQANLPLQKISAALEDAHIPNTISYFAGTFVCNFLSYRVMDYCSSKDRIRALFVHLPLCEKQAVRKPSTPYMHSDISAKAVELIIEVCTDKR